MKRHAGQQTAEFALVIGLAAMAAVTMQLIVRTTLQRGIQRASDGILPPRPQDDDERDTQKELLVTATNAADEAGTGDGRRATTLRASVVGHSVNEDIRLSESPHE